MLHPAILARLDELFQTAERMQNDSIVHITGHCPDGTPLVLAIGVGKCGQDLLDMLNKDRAHDPRSTAPLITHLRRREPQDKQGNDHVY